MDSLWQLGDEFRGQSKVSEDHQWSVITSKLAEMTRSKGERINNFDHPRNIIETKPWEKLGLQEDGNFENLSLGLMNMDLKLNEAATKVSLRNSAYNLNSMYQKPNVNYANNFKMNIEFLNATTMAGNTGGDDSNPFAALLGNQGNVQTRDRSTNPSDVENGSSPNSNPLPNPWSNAAGPTTTNTRSTPASEARSDLFGGLSVPELDAGGILDPSALSQMLQNPATTQMMQSILSNPQYVNQIFNMNPQLRSMMESNTPLREMVQNPEFLRQLASPEALQQALSSQQSLFTLFGQQPSNQGRNQSNGATGMEHLMQMFGGLGAGGNFGIPSNPDVPPEELYATQLSQLQEMGFFDTQENIRALIATAGNVHAAVERLLGSLGH